MGLKVIIYIQIIFFFSQLMLVLDVGARMVFFSFVSSRSRFIALQPTVVHGIILFVTNEKPGEKESKKFNYKIKESNEGTTTTCLLHCTGPRVWLK